VEVSDLRTLIRTHRDELVLQALQRANGNRRRAATALNVSVRTLLYQLQDMRRRGVDVPSRDDARRCA
jgi:transcriptional regulator with PAS, ATPase and Fis domain